MIQIKKLNTEDPNFKDQLSQLIFFEAEDNIQIEKTVTEILSDVKKRGDEAVIEYTKKFDHVDFSRMAELEISKEELSLALENLPAASRWLWKIYLRHRERLLRRQLREFLNITKNS